jgi:predicted TPR repeat methyltransferase
VLESAVEKTPEDPTANGHLGDAYEAVGRRPEAVTQWRRALILNPEPQDAAKLQTKLTGTSAPPVSAERRVE